MDNVKEWIEITGLEQLESNLFRGNSYDIGSPTVYGGQVLSQSLEAAQRTVTENRLTHSMHGYFILPGDLEKPIIFEVDHIRDGGSFTTRRVRAIQNGKAIFILAVSFHREEEDQLEHQLKMAEIEGPDGLFNDQQLMMQFKDHLPKSLLKFLRPRPVEIRWVDPQSVLAQESLSPFRHVWFKAKGEIPDSQNIHQQFMAYVSDYNLLTTAIRPHQDKVRFNDLQLASLDHAMWFHHKIDMSKWHLYSIDSPSASNGRGFTRGSIFNEEGKLVASVVQEGLMRKKNKH